MRRARTEAAEAEILDVLFFITGSDVYYLSFADALQADWLIRNAQITWIDTVVIFEDMDVTMLKATTMSPILI